MAKKSGKPIVAHLVGISAEDPKAATFAKAKEEQAREFEETLGTIFARYVGQDVDQGLPAAIVDLVDSRLPPEDDSEGAALDAIVEAAAIVASRTVYKSVFWDRKHARTLAEYLEARCWRHSPLRGKR
jgi:hypothetical protein